MRTQYLFSSLLIVTFHLASSAQWSGLDPTFGTDGFDHIDLSPSETFGNAGAIAPDDKIIVAGEFEPPGQPYRIGVARFLPDGGLDNSFSGDGIDSLFLGTNSSVAIDLALEPNGKIVVLAHMTPVQHALIRFLPDGGVDPTFGTNGVATFPASSGDRSAALSIQPDGKILVTGRYDHYSNSGARAFVFRANADGSLDTSFGTSGWIHQDIGTLMKEIPADVIAQDDGKVFLCGLAFSTSISVHFCARYNSDGTLDNSFNSGGTVVDSVGTNAFFSPGQVLHLANGKYVLAGGGTINDTNKVAVTRLNPNGEVDATFASDGWRFMHVPDRTYQGATGLAMRSDGSFLIGGEAYNQWNNDFSVIVGHLGEDGDVDHNYGGPTGLQPLDDSDFSGNLLLGLREVMVQSNDKLVGVHYMNYGSPLARQLGIFRVEQLAVGLEESDSTPGVSVFPNPANGSLTISFGEPVKLTAGELFTLDGRSLGFVAMDSNPHSASHLLQLPATMPSGSYILRLQTPEGQQSLQLMIE